MNDIESARKNLDGFTAALLDFLFESPPRGQKAPEDLKNEIAALQRIALAEDLTAAIVDLFIRLRRIKEERNLRPDAFGISRETLLLLAEKHRCLDEHGVTVGGRVGQALRIVGAAQTRVEEYLQRKDSEAPSGIELWPRIQENTARIRQMLNIGEDEWNTFSGQLKNCIDTVQKLSAVVDLPSRVIEEVLRVTRAYRMRLTPYYASLILRNTPNDPVLLQSVPTAEMIDNVGVEIPPVAADHSPARLIDQFYPRVLTIKATNMCAMYCTHCLRIAHIGKKDRIYSDTAYGEAIDYIRNNSLIRDVLITGGDAFMLPNRMIGKILGALDDIPHVRMKRLGTRIPVTAPQRIDDELLEILDRSNERKPVRVVTQINTAQEITPVSQEAFRRISKSVSAVLNQAVLLKGVNDSRVKMWKLCETIQESYVRPYYLFNCSYRNPQFSHFRVPVEKGRDIVESMYGNISGDAIPRYIATAGGKIPLHRSNVRQRSGNDIHMIKPWNGEAVVYPDADPDVYADPAFSFDK